ncbi:MAG: DUF1598 domain-containing protein [Planctomycetales bacterium]
MSVGTSMRIAALVFASLLVVLPEAVRAQLSGGGGFGQGGGGGQQGGGGQGGQQGGGGQGGRGGQQGGGGSGVLVDTDGVVRTRMLTDKTSQLDKKRRQELAGRTLPGDLNTYHPLRKVSLFRLEAACETFAQDGEHVTRDMQYLAGLQRIDYVFVDPEARDIVIAGPAEGFVVDGAGRAIGNSTGRPALRLDDLMVALRAVAAGEGTIGCSIDPTEENLARFKEYLARTSGTLSPAQAKAKFEKLGTILGMQTVSLFGVPPESHFAELLVEADIHMKRLAVGVERVPVKGFRSHLALVGAGENTMQRWWFTPLYDPFARSADGLAYRLSGQRVQLLAQEELVSETGKRTNAPFTRASVQKFGKQFTEKFPELAAAIPAFAELQSLFDLTVLAALIRQEGLAKRVGWPMQLFLDPERGSIAPRNVPRQVESLSNHKVIGKSLYVAQVGGGVTIIPDNVLQGADYEADSAGELAAQRDQAMQAERPQKHLWWWD